MPQNSTSQSTRQSPPDLVCCHVQAINGERELNNQPSQQRDQETTDELNNNTNSQLVPRRRRQESQLPSTPDIETDTSDRSMIEIQVNAEYTYRMIGEGLRKIADQFEIDRSKVNIYIHKFRNFELSLNSPQISNQTPNNYFSSLYNTSLSPFFTIFDKKIFCVFLELTASPN